MKKLFFGVAALVGLATMTGCSDNYEYLLDGEGRVRFATSFSNDVKTASRASADELAEQLSESSILWISKSNGNEKDGVVRKFNGLANIPAAGITLAGGNYVAELWAGDSVPASFDKKYYKARAPFTVSSGNVQVELQGRIANVVASVVFDETVGEVLSDYSMTIGHDRGSLTFDDPDNQKGYFMMPSTDKNLTWTLTGKKNDGTQYTRTGVIENAKPTTEYILHVQYTAQAEELGGGYLDIVIDNNEIGIEDEITIILPPTVVGYGFDINSPVYAPAYGVGRKSVYISAATSLKSVVVESSILTPLLGGEDVDLLVVTSESVINTLNNGGVNWLYNYDADADISNLKINFEEKLMNTLNLGEYDIKIIATDNFDKTTEATMHISVSDAKVVAQELPADAPTTWATSAVVSASIAADDAANYGIEYRAKGASEWIKVYPEVSRAAGDLYSVSLTGLTPGTTYEYRAFCDGFTGSVTTFTTEAAQQPQNAGFENWQTSSNPYLLYGSNEQMFWDSGNHGSATMRKNVTLPDNEFVHSGNYSAKLMSQFVGIGSIGEFAAGNAFVGKYLKTDGTNGILGFGRPFTSRPKAMRVYVKYRPVAIDYVDKGGSHNFPAAEVGLSKGMMDEGIIYLALLDGTIMDSEYPEFPVVIKTATSQLFDKNRSDVIAYGEKRFVGNTEGDGLVEFIIPLEYNTNDMKAKYLLLTCAASRGGDYFVGGAGSNMWIDDLEFIYE